MTRTRGWQAGIAAGVVAACLGGCGSEPPLGDVRVLSQRGFEGLALSRDTADVSTSDLEAYFPPRGSFDLRPESEYCGVAERLAIGVIAITDADRAVRAFLVTSPEFTTPEGVRVGSTREVLMEAYGVGVLAEVPTDEGSRIVVDDLERPAEEVDEGSHLYAFDLDSAGLVTVVRAGGFPWLLGCAVVAQVGSS